MHRERPHSGRDLKAERVRAGLTQEQLGALVGVSGRRIANVEGSIRVSSAFVERVLRTLTHCSVEIA